jgi:hypothetical protein
MPVVSLNQFAVLLAAHVVAFGSLWEDRHALPWVFDDVKNFVERPEVHALTLANAEWAINDGVILSVYEPVSLLIKMAISSAAGLSARSIVLSSVVVHLLNSVLAVDVSTELLTRLCLTRTRRPSADAVSWCAVFGAVAVGTAPLRAEVVAWVRRVSSHTL